MSTESVFYSVGSASKGFWPEGPLTVSLKASRFEGKLIIDLSSDNGETWRPLRIAEKLVKFTHTKKDTPVDEYLSIEETIPGALYRCRLASYWGGALTVRLS